MSLFNVPALSSHLSTTSLKPLFTGYLAGWALFFFLDLFLLDLALFRKDYAIHKNLSGFKIYTEARFSYNPAQKSRLNQGLYRFFRFLQR
jgi:hypothetical protein